MKKLLSVFNDTKMRTKLLLSYVFVVFLPVLLVGILLTNNLSEKMLDSAVKEAEWNLERVRTRFSDALNIGIQASDLFYGDQILKAVLSKEYNDTYEVYLAYQEQHRFDQYSTTYEEIFDIRVYVDNNTALENWKIMKADSIIKTYEWYQNALDNKGIIEWEYMVIPKHILNKKSYLTLTRQVNYGVDEVDVVLTICINTQSLWKIVQQEFYETIIINQKGFIIAAKDQSLTGQHINSIFIDEKLYADERKVTYNGVLSTVLSSSYIPPKSNGSFTIISLIPVQNIEKDAQNASYAGWVIIITSLVVIFILIILFSKIFSSRISRISWNMHNVASGRFNAIHTIKGNDEIGQLSNDMVLMVEGIKKLMEEVDQANNQKNQLIVRQKDIQFRMLANQINPHFLFNSLEAIRMRAFSKGEKEISEAVKYLGKIMRKCLETGNKPITLENELDLVMNYMALQKFRYGKKIEFSISRNNDSILQNKILPFTIQPLVENAVVHGFEGLGGVVHINIAINSLEHHVKITVQDDGVGMKPEKIKKILESFEDYDVEDGKRIGLRNVHQRIRLYYGEKYGVHITSNTDVGTIIELVLPKEGDSVV